MDLFLNLIDNSTLFPSLYAVLFIENAINLLYVPFSFSLYRLSRNKTFGPQAWMVRRG